MMQIFNNLRAILTRHKENMPVVTVAEMLAEIDEAEAKWEEDCCEWKPTLLHNHDRFSNCMVKFDELHRQDVECFSFCPYCGKRIKISEVE